MFSSPSAGWLPVTIACRGTDVDIVASYIPNNFVRDLIHALLRISSEQATAEVAANEEPVTKMIEFTRQGETVHLSISETHRDDVLLECAEPWQVVVMTFWRALRRLQNDPQLGEWRLPFPATEMDQLTSVAARGG
jgi:hypothetical protein